MQSLSEMTAPQWMKAGMLALILFVMSQLLIMAGQLTGSMLTRHSALDEIERRISLDTAYLDVGNQTLNTPVNDAAVSRYLYRINQYLTEQNYPIYVKYIQHVEARPNEKQNWTQSTQIDLSTAEQDIHVGIALAPLFDAFAVHPAAILTALLLTPILLSLKPRYRSKANRQQEEAVVPPSPSLIIDMNTKSIGNGINNKIVQMQNKPFCFYAALVRYSIDNPDATLPQNKDVPLELINLANRVFVRLIELGHTKRKRPDFNANLDKTLSEIRAALDDAFEGYTNEKDMFYPPRAQGEGSRSKQHSYALPPISEEDVTILGK